MKKTDDFWQYCKNMITDFCAVLLYLPIWDEWIEILTGVNMIVHQQVYLPIWDEWIEIDEKLEVYEFGEVSPYMG